MQPTADRTGHNCGGAVGHPVLGDRSPSPVSFSVRKEESRMDITEPWLAPGRWSMRRLPWCWSTVTAPFACSTSATARSQIYRRRISSEKPLTRCLQTAVISNSPTRDALRYKTPQSAPVIFGTNRKAFVQSQPVLDPGGASPVCRHHRARSGRCPAHRAAAAPNRCAGGKILSAPGPDPLGPLL